MGYKKGKNVMKMQKRQFRIGQLAKHLGVERFVVRFWEKEFNFSAHRSDGGQRFYEEKDLEKFKQIKKLLYEDGFTIAGAKKLLKQKDPQIIGSHKTTIDQPKEESKPDKKEWTLQLKMIRTKLKALQKQFEGHNQPKKVSKELQ